MKKPVTWPSLQSGDKMHNLGEKNRLQIQIVAKIGTLWGYFFCACFMKYPRNIFFSKCGILVQHSSLLYSSVDVSIWNTLSLVRIIQQVYILKVGSHHHACKSQPAKPWTGNFQKFVTVFLPVAVYVWLFHASNFLVVSLRKSAL